MQKNAQFGLIGKGLRFLVALLIEIVFFIFIIAVVLIVFSVVDQMVINPAIALFGKEAARTAWIVFLIALSVLTYGYLARELWRRNPPRPQTIGWLRWLVTIYLTCWRRSWSLPAIRRSYVAMLATTVVATVGCLFIWRTETALFVVALGMLTPVLALTTWLQPLVGLWTQPEEAT